MKRRLLPLVGYAMAVFLAWVSFQRSVDYLTTKGIDVMIDGKTRNVKMIEFRKK